MPQTLWSMQQIKQCEDFSEQAMLSDEQSLVSFSRDFGQIFQSFPAAIAAPTTLNALQKIIKYSYQQELPLTIRGNGLSQCGQSIAQPGSVIVHTQHLSKVIEVNEESIWVEANCTWADLITQSLTRKLIPYVIPYNTHLSVAGVLSAGGVGASSFKYGAAVAHVKALEVIRADGEVEYITEDSPLFHACLGGQGRFALITKAQIKLRPCKKKVKTFFLLYLDEKKWKRDMYELKEAVDYMEFFCTPAIQGGKLTKDGRRMPFAEWFYALQVAIEYDENSPALHHLSENISPWKIAHEQEEDIESYLHRHDGRFQAMKITGQWALKHPWYECFVPAPVLFSSLKDILSFLPLYYAAVLQIAPIQAMDQQGFFMLPEKGGDICAVMILTPGVVEPLVKGCLETIDELDKVFLPQGGKRYLSGYLGKDLDQKYWEQHFGSKYEEWSKLKKKYDPKKIFNSLLY